METLSRIEMELVNLLGDGNLHPVEDVCTRLDMDNNALSQRVFHARKKIARNYDIVNIKRGGKRYLRLVRLIATSDE